MVLYIMLKKTYNPAIILTLFLLVLLIKVFFQISENLTAENGYTFGDWLINYEDGGFKRRGLSGSFFIFLYDVFGISLKRGAFAVQFISYLLFFLGIVRLSFKSSVSYAYLGLIFLSCTFLFMYIDLGSIGRKEILLFAFYIGFLNLIEKFPSGFWMILVYLLLTTTVGILFHEIYFFYLPFFLLPFVYNFKLKLSKSQIAIIVFIIGGVSLLLVGGMKVFGGEINAGGTFGILESRGLSKKMSTLGNLGILTWNDDFDKVAYFKYNNYGLYLISLLFSVAIFQFYSNITQVFKRKYDFLLITLCTFLFSLPAYVLAIDWGRWLHIQFMLTAMYILYLHSVEDETRVYRNTKALYIYFALVAVLALLWRFELVDKGFYLVIY